MAFRRHALVPYFVHLAVACAPIRNGPSRATLETTNAPVYAGSGADRTQRIVVGPLTYDVTIARTAQVFYLVDQMSNW